MGVSERSITGACKPRVVCSPVRADEEVTGTPRVWSGCESGERWEPKMGFFFSLSVTHYSFEPTLRLSPLAGP